MASPEITLDASTTQPPQTGRGATLRSLRPPSRLVAMVRGDEFFHRDQEGQRVLQKKRQGGRDTMIAAARRQAPCHGELFFNALQRPCPGGTVMPSGRIFFVSHHDGTSRLDGTSELLQLAHLLRVGAETAAGLAKLRPRDAAEISILRQQLQTIADRLEEMTRQANGSAPASVDG